MPLFAPLSKPTALKPRPTAADGMGRENQKKKKFHEGRDGVDTLPCGARAEKALQDVR